MPHKLHTDCPVCTCWQPDDDEIMVVTWYGHEVWRTGDSPRTISTGYGDYKIEFRKVMQP